jgi:hypothetical protein
MPPVLTVKKPVGRSSKLAVCANPAAVLKASAANAARLVRKTVIGDGHLEVLYGWAGLENGQKDPARDHQNDRDNDQQHADRKSSGRAEVILGLRLKGQHGAGKLPARCRAGNRRSLETLPRMRDINA